MGEMNGIVLLLSFCICSWMGIEGCEGRGYEQFVWWSEQRERADQLKKKWTSRVVVGDAKKEFKFKKKVK